MLCTGVRSLTKPLPQRQRSGDEANFGGPRASDKFARAERAFNTSLTITKFRYTLHALKTWILKRSPTFFLKPEQFLNSSSGLKS